MTRLWQVTGLYNGHVLCAGLETTDDVVTLAAPILRRICLGKTRSQLRPELARRGWTVVRAREAEG